MNDFSKNFRSDLIALLKADALRTDGPFTLASGAVADWYLDARQVTFDGAGAVAVGRAMLDVIDDTATAVGGLTMGADPVANATAIAAAHAGRTLKSFSIRKQAKDHGTKGRLVGPVTSDDRAVVVEDTTTTGGSLLEAVDELHRCGIEVVQVISLVDRSEGDVARILADRAIPYLAVIEPADLGVTV